MLFNTDTVCWYTRSYRLILIYNLSFLINMYIPLYIDLHRRKMFACVLCSSHYLITLVQCIICIFSHHTVVQNYI